MSGKKVYVVSGVLLYANGEIYQDLTKVYARKLDALRDLAGRVRERLADDEFGAGVVEREAFTRCVVDDGGNVFGWNLDETAVE